MLGVHYLVELLFRSWWNGGRFARAIIFALAWIVLFEVLLGAHPGLGADPYALMIRLGVTVCGVLAWMISGIPKYRRRRRARHMAYADFYAGFNGP